MTGRNDGTSSERMTSGYAIAANFVVLDPKNLVRARRPIGARGRRSSNWPVTGSLSKLGNDWIDRVVDVLAIRIELSLPQLSLLRIGTMS